MLRHRVGEEPPPPYRRIPLRYTVTSLSPELPRSLRRQALAPILISNCFDMIMVVSASSRKNIHEFLWSADEYPMKKHAFKLSLVERIFGELIN
ncbi:hypothetical protein Gmet_3181 [Geobacter metallireducens GS-15]|uniref:Uncharacterized protein n=1 Tax=Geobacter metallireducens (strain ATCC 53774 / DSM 7210 / GS-15) TaxID=269799 RepID=Q39QT0_GEOMG|nr:hypothetical protein Gmet_3181 [Geobacter metallireducens GS-15]